MKLDKIILKSSNIDILGTFLSHLFEMEVESLGVLVTLKNDSGVTFQIEESLESIQTSNTVVELMFDSVAELHNLVQKIQFLEYRLEVENLKVTEITSDSEVNFFELTDFDNRVWRFSAR